MWSNGLMTPDLANDERLDPRLRRMLAFVPSQPSRRGGPRGAPGGGEHPQGHRGPRGLPGVSRPCDSEEAAPSAGLSVTTTEFTSDPDDNTVKLQVIRPESEVALPGVYYIHGGGMATMSCFDGMYRGWGKHIAANGVVVVMVDFRNCVTASSSPEVAPFPAGLNDCVSGLRWVAGHAADFGIDPTRIVVAGESGGGDLTLATGLRRARRPRARQGAYACALHRRPVAGTRVPLLRRERGHPPASPQQPGRRQLRDRGVQRAQPAGVAVIRQRGRRRRLSSDGDQCQRMRPVARRGDQFLPVAPRRRGAGGAVDR